MNTATLLVILIVLPIAVAILSVRSLRDAAMVVFRQRSFLGAVVLLGVAAVGLNGVTELMRVHFRKQAVPLAVSRLDDTREGIPGKLGKWIQVSVDAPLDHTTQEVLGTKDFVFRDYVDSSLVPSETVEKMLKQTPGERAQELGRVSPEAVVRVAITYYTGLVDTVPHVPEKCYVADGFEPTQTPDTRDLKLAASFDGGKPERTVSYRHVNFQDTTDQGMRADRDVCYLFHVNGHYEASNVGVRRELQNLFQPYGYFAKIELMTTSRTKAGDTEKARSDEQAKSMASIESVFQSLLPEVERCLPDWNKVTGSKK